MFNIFTTFDDGDIKEKAREEYKNIKASDKLRNKIMEQVDNGESHTAHKHTHNIKRRMTAILAAAISLLLIVGAGAAIYTGRVFIPDYGFVESNDIEIYTLPEIQNFGGMTIETVMRIKEDGKNKMLVILSQSGSPNSLDGEEVAVTTAKDETIIMKNSGTSGYNDFMYAQFEADDIPDINEFTLHCDGMSSEVKLEKYDPAANRIFECETKNGVSMKIQFFTKRSIFFAVDYENTNTPETYAYIDEMIANENYSAFAYEMMRKAGERSLRYEKDIRYGAALMETVFFNGLSFTDINGTVYDNIFCSTSSFHSNEYGKYTYMVANTRPDAEITRIDLKSIDVDLNFEDVNLTGIFNGMPNLEVGEKYEFETPVKIFGFDGFDFRIKSAECVRYDTGMVEYIMNIEETKYFNNKNNPDIALGRIPIHCTIFDPETKKFKLSSGFSKTVINAEIDPGTGYPIYDEDTFTAETELACAISIGAYKGDVDFSKISLSSFSYKIYGGWTFK